MLTLLGSCILIFSFYFPYWNLTLKAPQYPQGLNLSIYMDHVEGDTAEVNLLNHYIGMSSLDNSAQFERRIAWYAILALSIGAFLVIPVGRKTYKVFYLPPLFFLAGFIGDLFYWLYQAGHNLNPDAPVTIKAFTPTLLGKGQIGQFITSASFGSGFWIAVLATVLIFFVIGRKKVICQGCSHYQSCSMVCNRAVSWIGIEK